MFMFVRLPLLTAILLDGLGDDGGGGFGGVVLLNVSCGSGDSPPCFATTDADHDAKQDQ